jgi:hypothetical protein
MYKTTFRVIVSVLVPVLLLVHASLTFGLHPQKSTQPGASSDTLSHVLRTQAES